MEPKRGVPELNTSLFNFGVPQSPGNGIFDAIAEVTWSTQGSDVRREVSVGNGVSISGTAQAVKVSVYDRTSSLIYPPDTTTTADFTQPSVGATVNVSVVDSSSFSLGESVFITNGGSYSVTATPDGTHVTLSNLGNNSRTNTPNAIAGTNIPSGAPLNPKVGFKYRVDTLVTPGARPSQNMPPRLYPQSLAGVNIQGRFYSVAPGATLLVSVPQNVGIISLLCSVISAGAPAVPGDDSLLTEHFKVKILETLIR